MKLRDSIRFKMFSIMLTISILPVLILFIIILHNNNKYYYIQTYNTSKSEITKIASGINYNLSNIDNLLTSLIYSTYDAESVMLSILAQEGHNMRPTPHQRLTNYRKFEYVTSNLIKNNEFVEGVYLFPESEYVYSFVKNKEQGIEKKYKEAEWYKLIEEDKNLNVVHLLNDGLGNKIINARKFTDNKGRSTGILVVVCNDKIFKGFYESSLPINNALIFDNNQEVIYEYQSKDTKTILKLHDLLGQPSGFGANKDNKSIYIYEELSINDWNILLDISFDSQNRLFKSNSIYLLLVLLSILMVIFVLYIYMEKRYINPLVVLSKRMKDTSNNISITNNRYYENRTDEIGVLYRRFNIMIVQIDRLINDKYINEINQLENKLKTLMSQINAHFIFNTLENINCLAEIENNKQISMMSKCLGDMLRYNIAYDQDEIELKYEIEQIKKYIKIQEIRFGNNINFEMEIEDKFLNCKIIKFILQPIVENAIEHGFVGKKSPWIITLKTIKKDDDFLLLIYDNGVGINNNDLETIKERIYHHKNFKEELRYSNIGLSNVHQRIQLMYSDKYGISIDSKYNSGTLITLKLPFNLKG